MITSLLNSGFGHAVRFIAMVEQLNRFSNKQVLCLSYESTRKFIKENTKYYNCNVYNLHYYQKLLSNPPTSQSLSIKLSDKRVLKKIQQTTLSINDFNTNTKTFNNFFSQDTINCCLYHGDINISKSDPPKIEAFKKLVCDTASQHDIFFHINLQKPIKVPELKCTYISIPIITRQLTKKMSEVKKILGLSPNDKFILAHAGSAVMENLYRDLYAFYSAVNNLNLDYKIVVSNSLENNKFPFNSNIIKAPLFNNGIDLINASELVISKPGMGILQDCISTKKPLLFLPGDFPERCLKIDLLNSVLSNNLPLIKEITPYELSQCIYKCLSIKNDYIKSFSSIPTNGAEILAKSVAHLSNIRKKDLTNTIVQMN